MISTNIDKVGTGVWFKSIQHKNRHFNTKSLRLFDKKYTHTIYHTKVPAEPFTVRGKLQVMEDVQIFTVH